jgi:nitrogen fixation NifU-like protein
MLIVTGVNSNVEYVRWGREMNDDHGLDPKDRAAVREMLAGSGYSDKAIEYYVNRPHMGSLPEADQVTELTGPCGDTMKLYLKLDRGRIEKAKIQVLGCPGAVASAMAAIDLIKGKTIEQAQKIKDRDILRTLEELPDQKMNCIRLAVKTLEKALDEYGRKNGLEPKEDSHATF